MSNENMNAPRIMPEELTHMRRDVVDELDTLRGGDGLSRKFAGIAQRLLAELDRLSAQGGGVEIPGLRSGDVTRMVEQSKRERFPEIALARLMYQFIATGVRLRPSPPHPDTVEVSREDLDAAVITSAPQAGVSASKLLSGAVMPLKLLIGSTPSALRPNPQPRGKGRNVASVEKRATDALCEIMRDVGHGCCEESECWKKGWCPEAEKLARAVKSSRKPSDGEG